MQDRFPVGETPDSRDLGGLHETLDIAVPADLGTRGDHHILPDQGHPEVQDAGVGLVFLRGLGVADDDIPLDIGYRVIAGEFVDNRVLDDRARPDMVTWHNDGVPDDRGRGDTDVGENHRILNLAGHIGIFPDYGVHKMRAARDSRRNKTRLVAADRDIRVELVVFEILVDHIDMEFIELGDIFYRDDIPIGDINSFHLGVDFIAQFGDIDKHIVLFDNRGHLLHKLPFLEYHERIDGVFPLAPLHDRVFMFRVLLVVVLKIEPYRESPVRHPDHTDLVLLGVLLEEFHELALEVDFIEYVEVQERPAIHQVASDDFFILVREDEKILDAHRVQRRDREVDSAESRREREEEVIDIFVEREESPVGIADNYSQIKPFLSAEDTHFSS